MSPEFIAEIRMIFETLDRETKDQPRLAHIVNTVKAVVTDAIMKELSRNSRNMNDQMCQHLSVLLKLKGEK
jgi:hypothetical protein